MKSKLILSFLFIMFMINARAQEVYIIDDYSIEITFSSFFDCGISTKYILDNSLTPKRTVTYERFNLYTINYKNCSMPIHSDTLSTKLTKVMSDSLFDLSNSFINNFKLINRVDPNKPIETILDGGTVKIEICLMNMCKSVTYYNYDELDNISPEMKKLMEYIDLLTSTDEH